MSTTTHASLALFIGAAGGGLFWLINLPLPWMLGSLTAAAAVSTSGRTWLMPQPVRDLARPVIGVMAGSAFSPAIVAVLPHWWPAIALVAAYTVASTVLGFQYFSRLGGLDRTTAWFASSPGGLAELTLLGAAYGGDLRRLVLIHSIRIIVAVFTVPICIQLLLGYDLSVQQPPAPSHDGSPAALLDWLILIACGVLGYALAKLLKIPGGVMVPALVLSAIVHGMGLTSVEPPGWLVALVQVVIGSAAGSRFAGTQWKDVSRTLLHGVLWALILVAFAAAIAHLGTLVLDQPYVAWLLALSPGGTAEMTIIAYTIGVEAAFAITCQVCRIMLVYTTAPVLFALLRGRMRPPPKNE